MIFIVTYIITWQTVLFNCRWHDSFFGQETSDPYEMGIKLYEQDTSQTDYHNNMSIQKTLVPITRTLINSRQSGIMDYKKLCKWYWYCRHHSQSYWQSPYCVRLYRVGIHKHSLGFWVTSYGQQIIPFKIGHFGTIVVLNVHQALNRQRFHSNSNKKNVCDPLKSSFVCIIFI